MKAENQNQESSMSLSKERKIARKKEIKQMKRNAKLSKIISLCVIVVLVAGTISLVGYSIYRRITRIEPSGDYSATLNDTGFIDGVDAASSVELPDYKNITVALSDVEYSDESVEADIQAILKNRAELSKETDAAIVDGDKVNIDYVGTIDGEEFEGGNTQGLGSDLTIGSNSLIDDFEEQLIGHKIGDNVTVNVTFPDEYSNSPDLAGKDAVFEVTINGIYIAPEFTDEFVQNNLADYASTTDEYRAYVKQSKYEENLSTWIQDYLDENTTVLSYPEAYINHLKSLQKFEDQNTYESLNQFYLSYMGYEAYKSFESYVGMSEAKYDKSLVETVQARAKKSLIYQAICELEGISVTDEDYMVYNADITATEEVSLEDSLAQDVENYGRGYVMQELIKDKVIDYIKDLVTVE